MQLVPLSPAQAEGLRVVLATKLRILATGASKRGHELAEFYDSAAATVASLGDGGEFQAIGSELFASFCERALGD